MRKLHRGDARSLTFLQYFYTQFNVITTYLRMLFWPYDNTIYHNFPYFRTLAEPQTLASMGSLTALFLTAFFARKKQPFFAFGIFWFFLTLSVESSIFRIKHVFFIHRMYLPMVGLCLAFSTILVAGIKKRWLLITVSAAFILACCLATYQQNQYWKTDKTLMDKSVEMAKHKTISGLLFKDLPRHFRKLLG